MEGRFSPMCSSHDITLTQWCIYSGAFEVQDPPTMHRDPPSKASSPFFAYHHCQPWSRVGKTMGFLKTAHLVLQIEEAGRQFLELSPSPIIIAYASPGENPGYTPALTLPSSVIFFGGGVPSPHQKQ